jgi:hypothetical protein
MTEHDRGFTASRLDEYERACAEASSEAVRVVPGIEYSDAANTVHILVWGAHRFFGEALASTDLLQQVAATGAIAVLAHPSRKEAWKQFDPHWGAFLLGMEVWNRKTDGWAPCKTAASLMAGTALLPFVGMDFHTQRQLFPLATELEMQPPVTEAAVLACLRSRRCRATALGRPIDAFLDPGWRRAGLRAAESGRRKAALTLRKLKLR